MLAFHRLNPMIEIKSEQTGLFSSNDADYRNGFTDEKLTEFFSSS